MLSTAILVSSFVASATAAAVGTGIPLPLGEIGWEGAVSPGGPSIKVWGASFEDIEAKIRKDYPEFSIYEDEPQASPETLDTAAIAARAVLEKRTNCDTRFGQVMPYYVDQCVYNLRRINGNNCWSRARHCIRTQCIQGAAVGLCNDNFHDINIPCTRVADMAEHISRVCYAQDTNCKPGQGCWGENLTTFGQEFDGANYNVIVGQCGFFGDGLRPIKA